MSIYVNDNQDTLQVGTLRYAIKQANENPNINTIVIKSGLQICLSTELLITSNIHVIGEQCVIKSNKRHFKIRSSLVKFTSLTLENGHARHGGSIHCIGDLTLENITIRHCKAIYGGGIYIQGNLYMHHTKILYNQALKQAGGIYIHGNLNSYESAIDYNQVKQSSEDNFGGGLVVSDGQVVLNNTSVSHNTVHGLGSAGGVMIFSGTLTIQYKSYIDHNQAYNSGGVEMGTGNINLLNQSTISNNKSYASGYDCGGGGIVITKGNVLINQSTIQGNITQGMYSGGLVSFIGNVSIVDSLIDGNVNKGPGGGIAANFDSQVLVSNSKITNNTGSSLGSAIVNFSSGMGGVIINHSQITGNTLTNDQLIGQTIQAFLEVITKHSNRLASNSKSVNLDLQSVVDELVNKAKQSDVHKLLEYATATGGTVATLLTCPVVITNSKIANNYATKNTNPNNPVYTSHGGGLFSNNSRLDISYTQINNNNTGTDSAAIYSRGFLNIDNSNIFENRSQGQSSSCTGDIINHGKTNIIYSKIYKNSKGIYNQGDLFILQSKIDEQIYVYDGEIIQM